MKANESKRKKKGPQHGQAGYAEWLQNIQKGMRRNILARREKGFLTLREAALEFALPYTLVRRIVNTGEVPVIRAGQRTYIRRDEAARAFGVAA